MLSRVSICILTSASVGLLLSASAGDIKLKILPTIIALIDNKWSVNFTCTLSSAGRSNTSELTSANLTFLMGVRNSIHSYYDYDRIPDSCTTEINHATLQLSQCEHLEAYALTVFIECRLKHDDSVKSNRSRVKIKLEHPQPEILLSETEVYNWDNLTLLVNTGENLKWMYSAKYTVWVRNYSYNSVYQSITTVKLQNNISFVKAIFEDPFAFLTDDLIVKVNGTATWNQIPNHIIESISSQEVRLHLNMLVKPAPVKCIKTHQNDSSALILYFEVPKLNRNITYNIVIECDKTPKHCTVNITRQVDAPDLNESRGFNNGNSTEHYRIHTALTTLPPASNCTASVRAVSTAGGKWSEWNTHRFETVEGVPLRNPDVCSSCFSVQKAISKSTFDVVVYFVPLSDETAQGKVVVYKIRVLDENTSIKSAHYLNNTEVNHMSVHLVNLSSGVEYEIGIEAATSRGYNQSLEKSNKIKFSPSNVKSLPTHVTDFTVTLLNNTAARIIWALNEHGCTKERKLFLFWCKGNFQTKTCSDVLNWKNISSELRSQVIVFTDDESIFGIGFECDGKSSGILWNTCIYDLNAIPSEPKVESIQTTESSAAILLNVSDECSLPGRGRGLTATYRLSYCRTFRNESSFDSECSDAVTTLVHNRSLGGGGDLVIILDGLSHNQTYRLSIQSVSETNKSSGTVTKIFSTKYRESIGTRLVVFAAVGVTFVVLIVVILAGCRIYILNGQRDIAVVVKSSEKKVPAVNLTRSESYDDFVTTTCNYDVSESCCYEARYAVEYPSPPGLEGEQGDHGFSGAKGPEHCTPLWPGVALVSSNPVDHSYYRVRPEAALSFPVPVLISDSLRLQKFPFEEDNTSKNSSFRILPVVGGSLNDNVLEKADSNNENSLQKTECNDQEQNKDLDSQQSTSDCSSSCCSSGTQDYHYLSTVKSPATTETEKSGVAVANAVCDSGSGYVDGSARVATVIQPPPSDPPQSLMRDQGHGRNSMFTDLYRLSVSSECGGSDEDDDGGGSSGGSGGGGSGCGGGGSSSGNSLESQEQSKISSEDDGISMINSSLNGERTKIAAMKLHLDVVYPHYTPSDGDRVATVPGVPFIPVLPVCAPVTSHCPGSQHSGSQQSGSGSGSGTSSPSSCDVTNLGLASDEEDSETDLSCLDDSVECSPDQLVTIPVDSEIKFTSESILPPILST